MITNKIDWCLSGETKHQPIVILTMNSRWTVH